MVSSDAAAHGGGNEPGDGRRPWDAETVDGRPGGSTGDDGDHSGAFPGKSRGVSGDADHRSAETAARHAVEPAESDATVRQTRRWRGTVAVVLLALAVGVLAARPGLLLVAALGVVFAAYPHLAGRPEPELAVARRVHSESPSPGETITVTTTVRNVGDSTLFDLRIVDGVPPMLPVVSGTPRRATALRPGEATTVTYSLEADRATHRFGPLRAMVRDPSGGVEVEATLVAETTIEADERLPDVPLRGRTRDRTGRLVTDAGGSGVEFHRTRAYEPGDPVTRIDWRTFARTGELTTVEFREDRLAEVVVCVDVRPAAHRAASADEPHAVAYGVGAAGRIADALFEADHRVGLAAFGAGHCWLPPGSGRQHEERLRATLASDPAVAGDPPRDVEPAEAGAVIDGTDPADADGGDRREQLPDRQLSTLRSQLGGGTQVVLLTPLCDDGAARVAHLLESAGTPVTVVSVDVTTDETAGGRLARLERSARLQALRNAGVPVIDWDPDRPLGTAAAAAGGRRA